MVLVPPAEVTEPSMICFVGIVNVARRIQAVLNSNRLMASVSIKLGGRLSIAAFPLLMLLSFRAYTDELLCFRFDWGALTLFFQTLCLFFEMLLQETEEVALEVLFAPTLVSYLLHVRIVLLQEVLRTRHQ